MIKSFVCVCGLLVSLNVVAASLKPVKGKVVDRFNNPLPGATIQVTHSPEKTITDVDGNFNFETIEDAELIVSYIGFRTLKLKTAGENFIHVVLDEDSQLLNDVVVVGYSTNKKVNLSGSVSSLNSEKLANRRVSNVSSALQGMAAGVTVTTQSGEPGGNGGHIRIRGIGTFGGDSAAPLVLVDGVEGTIDEVDPNIIESVSVLKDAASASIYGSRAANGVILVTTKRGGSQDKFSISYKGYFGFQGATMLPQKVDALEYMQLENVAAGNDGSDLPYSDEYIREYVAGMATDPDIYPNTDWQDLILTENGFNHGHTLTLTSSSERIKTLTSIGYLDQTGIVVNSSYRKISVRNNMDIKLSDRLDMKFDIQVSNANKNSSPYEGHAFNYMNTRTPNIVNQFTTGLYNGANGLMGNNPVLLLREGGIVKNNVIRATMAMALTYKILDGWNVSVQATPRYITKNNHNYKNSVTTYGDPEGTTSFKSGETYNSLTESAYRYFYWNTQALTNYEKQLDDHYFKVMAGMECQTYTEKTLSAYRQVFNFPQYDQIDAGNIENMNNGGGEYQWAINSFFGRLNYNYKERYLVEANIRTDGSSRFAEGNRYGVFPSFSAAWRISEEPFMESIRDRVDNLKLRASWGKLGNQNIGSSYYPTTQQLSTGSISMGGNLYTTSAVTSLSNRDLTWETSTMTDLGIDLSLFGCINITADWYRKITDGILMKLDIPNHIGMGAPFQNAGKVRNQGWELSVGYSKKLTRDFSLDAALTLSDVKNTITDMRGTSSTSGDIRNQEGSSINSIYGLICDGFINSQEEADEINANCPQFGTTVYPGDLKYRNVSGDNKITTDDKTIIGSTVPRYSYSFNLGVGYKGIRLSAFLQGVGKADGYLNSYYVMPCYQGGTYRKEHLDYWTEQNHDASTPRLSYKSSNNTYTSSFWMKSAAYLRLKNLQLGYDLPSKWMKAIGLKSAYIYANAENLLTFTDFWDGYDPEVNYNASSPVCTFKRLPFTAVISKRPFLSVATRTNGFSSTETKAPATGFPFSSRTLPVTLSSLCAQPFKVTQANIAKASILYFFILFYD